MNTLSFQKTVQLLVLACMLFSPLGTAAQVQLDAALSHPVLRAGEQSTAYLRVGLTGFDVERAGRRPSVNVALVLDKSGSMSGDTSPLCCPRRSVRTWFSTSFSMKAW